MSLIKLLKKKNKKVLFTTPSHSQCFYIYKQLKSLYKSDISETEIHNPTEALCKAQQHAAKIYKTNYTYFLTNGSTSGILAALMTCVNNGEKVLICRESHPCHLNGVQLAGGIPIFYDAEINENWGIQMAASPAEIEKYLKAYDIKALVITSPTYEGIVSDVEKIKKLCEAYNTYLIVDEAHGALYPFTERLPQSSIKIADFTVQSLHKTAGGLNPTALLHSNCNLDPQKALNKINTTSPSYPLLASIEANINYLNSWQCKRKLNSLIDELELLHDECQHCEFFGDDITKIIVKIPSYTGEELSEILYKKYNIEDEKTNTKSTMLLCGLGTDTKKIKKLKKALLEL